MTLGKRWLFWLGIAALLLLFLYAIKSILLPFIIGILTAYFLDPAADRLERAKFSRFWATATISILFFAVLVTGSMFIVPILFHQTVGLLVEVPNYFRQMVDAVWPQVEAFANVIGPERMQELHNKLLQVSDTAIQLLLEFAKRVFDSSMAVFNILSLLMLTPVVTFYLLRDWDVIVAKIDALLPKAYEQSIREQVRLIDQTLSSFLHGQMHVIFVLSVYYAIVLSLVGLKFALIMAVLSAVLVLIPYVGTVVTACVALGLAYAQFGIGDAFWWVVAIYMFGQIFESQILTPKLVGEQVGLHPLWVIFGMLAGAALFGFVGVFLAVPLTAVIGVLTRFAVSQYRASTLYDPGLERAR